MRIVLRIGPTLCLDGVNHKVIFWKETLMKRHSLIFIAPVFDDQGQRMAEDRVLLEETIEVVPAE
jgi:hypothetical protein